MRIAMIGSRGIPAHSGGVEHVTEDLSRELTACGHEVLVYTRPHYITGPARPELGRRIVTPGVRGKHLETITHTATAMLDMLRRRVDVVHIHSPGPALLSWFARLAKRPVVFTIHGPDWRGPKWSTSARRMLKAGLRCGMKFADAVTTPSRILADELTNLYAHQVEHIPNGVRPAKPHPVRVIGRWGLAADQYALNVGRIVPGKQVDMLAEAWTEAKFPMKLVIVGELDNSRYVRRCLRWAGLNVLFLGRQYGQVLAELYSNAAMVVQPSIHEGMSLVLLEAAAYGRCVVAADIPENRDVLGDACIYYAGQSSTELLSAVGRCANSKELRESLGSKAKSFVERNYSWQSSARRFEQLYRHLRRPG